MPESPHDWKSIPLIALLYGEHFIKILDSSLLYFVAFPLQNLFDLLRRFDEEIG
jgi:hypothetical protein